MINSPLSFSQERIFLIDKFLVDNLDVHIYNVPVVIELFGELQISKLNDAINCIINRHNILRSEIKREESGNLYQQIPQKLKYKIVIEDISLVCEEQKQNLKQKIISKNINYKFQILSSKPLFISSLLKLDKNKYTLLFVFHHIIMDEWSIEIFLRELERFYNDLVKGKKVSNTEQHIQFDQYCKLQKKRLKLNYFANKIAYWNKKFSLIPNYENKLGFSNLSKVSDSGFYQIRLDSITTTKIEKFCKKNLITPFIFLITLYFILLKKLVKKKDIYVAVPIANRIEENSEDTMGCFVSTIILHSKIEEHMKFLEVLTSTKKDFIDAFDNQDAPIHLRPAINDKYNIIDELQNFIFELKTKNKYQINLYKLDSSYYSSSDFSDRNLSDDKLSSAGILLELEYQIDTYEIEFAKKFMKCFLKLLELVLSDSSIQIEKLLKNFICDKKTFYQSTSYRKKIKQFNRKNNDQKNYQFLTRKVITRLNNTFKLSIKY